MADVAFGIELTLRTLLGSPNPRATELLAIALESSEVALRLGAVRALAMREDESGHRRLVEVWPTLGPDARAALADLPPHSPLTETLPRLIRPEAPKLARRASEIAVALGIDEALPAVVNAAIQPRGEFAAVFAADAYQLAGRLCDRVEHYDPKATADGAPHAPDPAFARRTAVNALVTAMDGFGVHGEIDLLHALLLLTPGDEPALMRALHNEQHAAHAALLEALHTSRCRGAIAILAHALSDLRSPQRLIEIAAQRCDREGLEALMTHIGYPVGLRVRENCHRLTSFAWIDEQRRDVLRELSGAAQASAIQLAAASQANRRSIAALIQLVLESEDPVARLAACRAIDTLPSVVAIEPLRQALQVDDPAVVAVAVRLVRKKDYPGGTSLLVGMLDYPDARVRDAAGKSLRELSFVAYRDSVDELPHDAQVEVGRLVGKADPMAAPTLRTELTAGAVSRRLRALELIGLMGLGDELADAVLASLTIDKDIGVRCEAARLLATMTPTAQVIDALVEAVGSRSSAVGNAAQTSLEQITGQPISELMGAQP